MKAMEMNNQDSENTVSPSTQAFTGLTGIHSSIHWPATPTDVEAENDELDEIAIEHFLDTLAEVALSVAARRIRNEERNEG